uniref:Uncharacterized protein n=1 Tax=Alexandrium catenella TaxID=2925 RepID=A0A7S1PR34_ALECA
MAQAIGPRRRGLCASVTQVHMLTMEDAALGPVPDFITQWSPERRAYGIFHLLQCRALMPGHCPKPPEVLHLKFLATGGTGHSKKHGHNKSGGSRGAHASASSALDSTRGDATGTRSTMAPEVHDGELAEVFEDAGSAGCWWRICTQDEVLVRGGISLFSDEVRRLQPGGRVQQAGLARRYISGQMSGIVRIPIQPNGWVTADARAAGGPRYLERTDAPRWLVIYESGLPHGDVLVRAGCDLESKEVAVLKNGDIVEQSGPQELQGGVLRMPVVVTDVAAMLQKPGVETKLRSAASSRWPSGAAGWVTVDARLAGGPVFLQSLSV